MDSDQEENGRLAYATFLVKKVFDEVCEEFRLWKKNYASRLLRELAHPPSLEEEDTFSEPETSNQEMSEADEIPTPPSPTLQYMEIRDLETGTTQQVPTQVFRIFDAFPVPPPYEYCTRTDRNIFLGDDPSYMPFLPFHDDPTFDQAKYATEYKGCSWEKPVIDPDCEVSLYMASCLFLTLQRQWRS